MVNDNFETTLNRIAASKKLDVSTVPGRTDYVVSACNTEKAVLIRNCIPLELPEQESGFRLPAPHYNVQAVAFYRIRLTDEAYLPDACVLTYYNGVTCRNYHIPIKTTRLLERLSAVNEMPDKTGCFRGLLWIFEETQIFLANGIGLEGEWYLLGSGLWKDTERDLSFFLGRWNCIL